MTSAAAARPSSNTPMTAALSKWSASFFHALSARARRIDAEDGQALVEYALILVLIAIFAVTALQLLGTSVAGALQNVTSHLP
jgi:pilus assembly protein Flp/PilA